VGVTNISVTANAITSETGMSIYEWVRGPRGVILNGKEGAEHLIDMQIKGVRTAVQEGFTVKINTVYIPGINEREIPNLAEYYGRMGVHIMNITPLIPLYRFKDIIPPTSYELEEMRERCGRHILQFTSCFQCRADACGPIYNSVSVFEV
jgi:nitrogen fixation protein NifB